MCSKHLLVGFDAGEDKEDPCCIIALDVKLTPTSFICIKG